MSVANSSSLTTVFNTSPYYDDYDSDKGYYRILFKPSLAVQARELTQLQTILQNQIDRFGEHIFKEGSLVLGGAFNLNLQYDYVKIVDNDVLGNPVNLADFLGKQVVGAASGVVGTVVNYVDGEQTASPDTKTLYIKYQTSGNDYETKTFLVGEQLDFEDGISVNVISDSDAIGMGSAFGIRKGVLFAKDHFISFGDQQIILDKYGTTPTYIVGFDLVEKIVNSNEDPTLLDPAQGSLNYAAPGADRLQIKAYLAKKDIGGTDKDFAELLQIRNGIVESKSELPQYNVIKDEFARRTYDESGNYIVRGLNIRIREHLDDGTNFGYLSAAQGGNSSQLAVGVAPGKAYVFGYEVNPLITSYMAIDKGIDYKTADQQIVAANYGNYATVNEVVGSWNVNDGVTVELYDAPRRAITSRIGSSGSPAGSLVGTAKLKAFQYLSGSPGANTASYNAYLYDIVLSNGSFDTVRSIYHNGTNATMFGDVVLESGAAYLKETNFNTSLFPIGSRNVRRIRDDNGNIDTTYTFMKNFDILIGAGGTFSVSTGSADEIFPFSVGPLNNAQKLNNFVVSLNAPQTVSLTGTVSVTNGTAAMTGAGTSFNTQLRVGDKVVFTSTGQIRTIAGIADNTTATLDEAVTSEVSASAFKKQYMAGDLIDFTVNGSSGNPRSIVVSSSTASSFDMEENLDGTISATVLTNLNRTNAREIKKTIFRDRYVQINTATHSANNVGPWTLGLSDVYRVTEIRRHNAPFTTGSEGTDVTDWFELDNGQRDNYYDHAKIKLKSGSIGPTDYLLVKLDYFLHDTSQGVGYYSIDSYPIDDINGIANTAAIQTKDIPIYVSPTTGVTYNLRDVLDIRPTRSATATNAATPATATVNPASTTDFAVPSGGLHIMTPNESFVADMSYYLGRKDLIVVNPDGDFRAIRGVPDVLPITPGEPADSMAIAVVEVAPFPSLPADLASTLGRPEYANKTRNIGNKVYTMRDIGVLDNRITNLEYYVQLSLAEQETLNMKILDENGLDRFKNGIFVDSFTSHSAGDVRNPFYKCAIDRERNELRPMFSLNDIGLKLGTTAGTVQTGQTITLPFTHVQYTSQPFATDVRNAAGLFYKYIGELYLNPTTDYWIDTTVLPDLVIEDDGNIAAFQAIADAYGIDWNDWQTTWTGSSTTSQSSRNNRTVTTRTTTTTTSNQTRTGQELVVSSTNKTENYGTRVVDVSVIPFMRSIPVLVSGTGFRAETKLFAFFDGEDVNAYITPLDSSGNAIAAEGTNVITDSNGRFWANYRIPSDDTLKFTTGTKTLRFTDSFNNSSSEGAVTTAGEAQFTASGLNQSKQDTVVNTQVPQVSLQTVQESRTLVDTQVRTSIWTEPSSDPIGQTFDVVVPNGIPGMFITKIDLYFQKKDPTFGIFFELREVDASGMITARVLPGSKVHVENADINLSDDSTAVTTISFPAPIFLLNNTTYAFVVKPEANNPNTVLWTAKLGGEDILTEQRVNEQPHAGVLFVSSNDKVWGPIHDEDLKFTIHRASFNVGSGTVTMVNRDIEFFELSDISGTFEIMGETIRGEPRLTLGSIAGGVITVGMKIVGNISGTEGTVIDIAGNVYRVSDVPGNQSYQVNEPVTVLDSGGSSTGISATATAVSAPSGKLVFFNIHSTSATKMQVTESTGTFSAGEQIVGVTSGITATIDSIIDMPVSVFDHEVSSIVFDRTDIMWGARTTTKGNTLESGFNAVMIGENVITSSERKIASRRNEINNLAGNKSLQLRGTMSTTSEFVSPIIDLTRSHSIIVHNQINNDATGEDGQEGGNALARYITQKVTLADGQDAEDLQVMLQAWRPPEAQILVYFKALNAEDIDVFDDRNWIEMARTSKDFVSNKENTDDMRDFTYTVPADVLTGPNGAYQYTNSNGVTFTGYKYFAVKIVMLSTETSLVPRIKNLRVIALQR